MQVEKAGFMSTTMKSTTKRNDTLDDAYVAELLREMGFEHPKERGRDSLDFKDIAVWSAANAIRKAIEWARKDAAKA